MAENEEDILDALDFDSFGNPPQPQAPTPTPATMTDELDAAVQQLQPQEEQRLAGKFDSVDDLEKGYAEADKLIGRQGQQLGELQKELAELRGMMQGIAAAKGDDEPQANWYDNIDHAAFEAAWADNPGRLMDALVQKVVQEHFGDQFTEIRSTLEEQSQATEMQQASERSAIWLAEHGVPKPVVNEMQRIYEQDIDFWSSRIVTGDDAKAQRGLEQLAKLAKTNVGNGSSSTGAATQAKLAAQTAPASAGQSRQSGTGTPQGQVDEIVRQILGEESRSRKDPLMR